MNFDQFKLDEVFYTAMGGWLVLDISTRLRCILAKKEDASMFDVYYDEPTVFTESDFGGCRLTPYE